MDDANSSGMLRLSYKVLSVASVTVAVVSLTTLVVVTSLRGNDALNTVAIALAILAFVVQILVYVVQTGDAASQQRRSQELHSELMSLLTELRERASGTQKSMESINSRLLEAVIGKTQSEGIPVDTPEFASRVASRIEAASSPVAASAGSGRLFDWPDALDPESASLIHSELKKFPSRAEVDQFNDVISRFSDDDWLDIYRLGRDLANTTSRGSSIGPGLGRPTDALLKEGLAEKIPGWRLYTLTPKGRLLARIFTAGPDLPDELASFEPLRHRIERLRDEIRHQNRNRE